jgi:hypothetical protein
MKIVFLLTFLLTIAGIDKMGDVAAGWCMWAEDHIGEFAAWLVLLLSVFAFFTPTLIAFWFAF